MGKAQGRYVSPSQTFCVVEPTQVQRGRDEEHHARFCSQHLPACKCVATRKTHTNRPSAPLATLTQVGSDREEGEGDRDDRLHLRRARRHGKHPAHGTADQELCAPQERAEKGCGEAAQGKGKRKGEGTNDQSSRATENQGALLNPRRRARLHGNCKWDSQLGDPGKLPRGIGAQRGPERVRGVPRGARADVLYAVEDGRREWCVPKGGCGARQRSEVVW